MEEPESPKPPSFFRWMLYSTILSLTLVLSFALLFVIPKFEAMFKEMEIGELPVLTKLILAISNAMLQYWYVCIPAICAVVWLALRGGMKKDSPRMPIGPMILFLFLGLLVATIVVGLFNPLITIMERIGAP